MEEIIFTKIYHGGILFKISVPTYVGNFVPTLRYIIKDHFSILELLYYTKELGYETVGDFYVKDLLNKKWVIITTDQHLLHLIKNLKHEDTFEVFVCHVLDEPLLDTEGPRGYLTNVGGEGAVNLGGEGEAVDLGGEGEAVNLGGEGEDEDVNLGEEGEDVNLGGKGVDDNLGREGESDFLSSDLDLDIPSEDEKKATEFEEILLGEAGGIDRGFKDIGKNKTDKYAGKLDGDEDYIDSSDCWSDDSDEQLDVDAVRRVDIPARRRSKKVRTQSSEQSSVCADTTVVPRTTQTTSTIRGPSHSTFRTTYVTTQTTVRLYLIIHLHFLIVLQVIHISLFMLYSLQWKVHHILLSEPQMQLHNQVNQVLFVLTQYLCQDLLKIGFKLGLEEDWEEKKANARRTSFVTERDSSSSQLPPLSGHKRPYSSASFAVAAGGNRRPATGFGVYSDPTTRVQVFNPGTSSEKIQHGPTKLKSDSPTNIDIGFKPRGLKWKEKDAVGTSQLQQMKENRKNWK
ncbi:hypothetical protein R3W88_005761 [Solanum pinnatisectum]|uniref:PB1-like domain-containing protein n=1 Tax=Solanum pinnatisectum TaxID=50273 RepID=A0AAV9KCX1_9SOLN|nr:hypothetical protein R3W88_005761 [Solanum pinnatisectum]